MKTLRDIMRSGFLFTVQKKAMVSEAVRLMADHNVGIVIVLDGSRLAGVFSERDVVRRVLHQGLDPARTPIGEVMTGCVITGDAEMDYESAMRAMDEAGIRHLLVTSGSRMLSMISVRDLMRAAIHDRDEEVQQLREYLYQVPAGSPKPQAASV
jgi:CBS domain-containing protein